MGKVIVIGLDGGTFDIIKPMIEEGKLPTFKKLIENGVHGILESTIPPVTIPAWPCMYTGKRPEKLGVYGFSDFKESHAGKLTNSKIIREKNDTLFDLLGKNDVKVASINVPATYPPWKINGFMVTGMMTPRSKDNAYYPKDLKKELDKLVGTYEIHEDWGRDFEEGHMLRSIVSVGRKQHKSLLHLLPRVNFAFYVYRATDMISHLYFVKNVRKVEEIYGEADRFISKILALLKEDDLLIIVSDHGFRAVKRLFHTNTWLNSLGMLKRASSVNFKARFKQAIGKVLAKFPTFRKVVLNNVPRSVKNFFPREMDMQGISWEKTRVYAAPPSGIFGRIYVRSQSKNEDVRAFLKKRLKNLRDENECVIENVWFKEELYGREAHNAPDIIFSVKSPYAFSFKLSKDIFSNVEVGEHDMNGIFLAYGKGIKKGFKIKNAKIYDIAPTILHMFGLKVPKDMDGRVLKEIFEKDSEFAKKKVEYYEDVKRKEERILRESLKDVEV